MTDEQAKRNKNYLRFTWHERVIADPEVRKRPTSLSFAGLIMHRYRPETGYAEVSLAEGQRCLNLQKKSVMRARDHLVKRGWLTYENFAASVAKPSPKSRYRFAGGPEDFELDCHLTGDTGDPSGEGDGDDEG